MSSLGSGYTLQTCLQACDADSQCDAATFSEQFTYCTLFNGALSTTYSSTGTVYIYKVPGTSSSASTSSDVATSTSTSFTSSTTSSSASSTTSTAPLTCAQLGGTYTGASNTIFEVTCGAILGGSASPPTRVDSFEQCMDLCQADSTCVGVSFFPSMGRCYLVAVYVICIYVFYSYTSYSYLTYNYNIHPIFNSIHLYNFTGILRVHLHRIDVTVHGGVHISV
ncbi:hypothetical protein FVER14953_20581 [Fusarium verticillioides]|nr:hypothetical protein FVER14953_20581 [Fusarium verticillioides]